MITFLFECCCTLLGGQSHKRRRTSEPIEIEDRLESLICRVGEKVMDLCSKCTYNGLLAPGWGIHTIHHQPNAGKFGLVGKFAYLPTLISTQVNNLTLLYL